MVRACSGRNLLLLLGGIAAAVIGLFMSSGWIVVLGLLIAVLAVLSPAMIGRRDYRRLCERHPGGIWEKTVLFYPDRIESITDDAVTAAGYDCIRREYESERMYILDFGKTHPAAAFDKGGFTKGSMEELRVFLTEARRRTYDPPPEETVDQQGKPFERKNKKGE